MFEHVRASFVLPRVVRQRHTGGMAGEHGALSLQAADISLQAVDIGR
jgi:hypothetical protein